jgi:hypothetical protein
MGITFTGGMTFGGGMVFTASVPEITAIAYPDNDIAADTVGGQTITLTGTGFQAGATVIINNAPVGVVTVVSSTEITFISTAVQPLLFLVFNIRAHLFGIPVQVAWVACTKPQHLILL